jgi:hypothetical protein
MFCNSRRRELKGTHSHSSLGSFRTDVQRYRRFFTSCEWNKNRRDERQERKIICRIRYKTYTKILNDIDDIDTIFIRRRMQVF